MNPIIPKSPEVPKLSESEIDFLTHTVFGPEKADKFLTHIYGDYKKLPSLEQQVSNHNYEYVNLEKGFETYEKTN